MADWNGDGFDELGVFDGGRWYLDRNADGIFDPATEVVVWGEPGWTPAPGDWNGDGVADLGVVAPDSTWFRDRNGDGAFDPASEILTWGVPGSVPVPADWNGDGRDDVGVFAGGVWFVDFDGNGRFDPAMEVVGWGVSGWTPAPGDWNGDGATDLGVVAPGSTWFRDVDGDRTFNPATEILGWGFTGATPLVEDWDGDGRDQVGVFSAGAWFVDLTGDEAFDAATEILYWGTAISRPVPGRWGPPAGSGIQIDPPDGSANVSTNRTIVLTLPRPIDPASVTDATVQVRRGGGAVAVTRQVSYDGRYIAIAGALNIPKSTVEVVVAGLTESNGTPLSGELRAVLTSSSSSTYAPFGLAGGLPSPVPVNASLHLYFNSPMNPTTFDPSTWFLERTIDHKRFLADCSLSRDWLEVVCLPQALLDVGSDYGVAHGTIHNLFGYTANSGAAFRTGFSEDHTAPRVVGALPSNGSAALYNSNPISIFFDEPVAAGPATRVELVQSGVGSLDVTFNMRSGSANEIVVRPVSEYYLELGATYGLVVDGFRNGGGLPMTGPFHHTFTLPAAGTHSQDPSVSPPADSVDVPVNARVVVTFPEPVIEESVTPETFFLRGPAGAVPARLSIASGGLQAVLTPLSNLAPNAEYIAEYTGDLVYPSSRGSNRSWRFRTGNRIDTTPPYVESVYPPSGAMSQPLRVAVMLRFSEEMPLTALYRLRVTDAAGTPVSWSFFPSSSGRTVQLDPYTSTSLQANTLYYIRLSNATDLAGNPLPPFVSSFRTGSHTDTARPYVSSMSPSLGSTGVGLEPVIELTMSEPLSPPSVHSESTHILDQDRGELIDANVALSPDGRKIVLSPLSPLLPMTRYSMSTAATDTSGNALLLTMEPLFTTGPGPADVTPPQVVSMNIAEGALIETDFSDLEIELMLSEAVDPATIQQSSFLVLANGRALGALPSSVSSNRRFRVAIGNTALEQNKTDGPGPDIHMQIRITHAVRDFAGNGLSPEFVRDFDVNVNRRDTDDLYVREVRPGGSDASQDAPVTVVFSSPFVINDPSQGLYVSDDGRLATGTTQVVGGGQALLFTPDHPWTPGGLVQVFPRPGIYSAANGETIRNVLFSNSFHVQADPAATAPKLVAFSPAYSCCPSIPSNARWTAKFSEALDPASVDTQSVRLLEAGVNPVPAAVRLVEPDTIELTPAASLQQNRSYALTLTAAVRDLQGNPIQAVVGPSVAVQLPPDSTAPSISAVSPPNGLANVPLNAPIRVALSEAADLTSISTRRLTLLCGGTPVGSGRFDVALDQSRVFDAVPETLLPPNQSCTATLSGLRDTAGNVAPSRTWSFQTGSSVDAKSPESPELSPRGSAVGTNAIVAAKFSEPIDPTSLDPQHFELRAGGEEIPVALSFSPDAKTLTFTPARPLPVGLSFELRVNQQVRDLAGNGSSSISHSFGTGFAPDTTPPSIVGASIQDGETNLSPLLQLTLTASEALDPASVNASNVQLLDGGAPLPVFVRLQYDGTGIELNAFEPLALQHSYTVRVSGLKDGIGNAMVTPFTLGFTTRPGFDFARPTAETNVKLAPSSLFRNVAPRIRFSEPLDPATVRPDTIYFESDAGPLPSLPVLDSSGLYVELRPTVPLPANSSIRIAFAEAGVTDLSGNPFWQQVHPFASFRTGSELTDTQPPLFAWPSLLTSGPLPRNFPWGLLNFIVSESLDPWSYQGDLVEMRNSAGNLVQSWTLLNPGASYTLSVKPASDFAGNALTPPAPLTFTTTSVQDVTAPSVVGIHPALEATGVPVDVVATVDFSEPVWIVSPNLYQGGSVVVETQITMSLDGRRLTIDPTQDLLPNTRYNIYFSAYDIGNNELDCCRFYSASFTTGAPLTPDTEPPVLLSSNPPDGATGVSDPTQTLTFSERLDPASVSTGISLFVNGALNAHASGSVTADGATVRVSPYGQVEGEAEIAVVVSDSLTDLAGNPASPFITRFQYVNPQPTEEEPPALQIQSVRPANGATDVSTNASFVVFFNRPIDPASAQVSVLVSEDGLVVSGDILVDASAQVLQFVPHNRYAAGARVRLFLDLQTLRTTDGAAAGAWTHQSSFLVADEILPAGIRTRVSVQNDVPRNAHIVIDFDRPMDPVTFTDEAVRLTQPDTSITYSLENADTRLRIIPSSLLPANTQMALRISNSVLARDGTALQWAYYGYGFRTSAEVISDPTEIVSMSPPDGGTGVGLNGSIDIVFSRLVNELTVNASTIQWAGPDGVGVPCTIEFSRSGGRSSVHVTPHDPFAPFAQYTVAIQGVEDLAGQIVPPREASFTAGAVPDFAAPSQLSLSPQGQSAALNTVVKIEFSEPLSSSVDAGSLYLSYRDPALSTYVAVPSSLVLTPDGRTIVITPDDLLMAHTQYELRLGTGIRDLAGNEFLFLGFGGFTTGNAIDVTPPELDTLAPPDGASGVPLNHKLLFLFDSDLRPSAGSVRLESGGDSVPVRTVVSGAVLEVQPLELLQALTPYTWTLEGFEDMAGNSVASPLTGTFSTGSTVRITPNRVLAVSPPDGSTNVPRTATLAFQFESALNIRTAAEARFFIWNPNGSMEIPVKRSYSPDFRTVTLTPDDPLPPNATLTAACTGGGIQDLTAQPSTGVCSSTFNTGP